MSEKNPVAFRKNAAGFFLVKLEKDFAIKTSFFMFILVCCLSLKNSSLYRSTLKNYLVIL